MPDVKMNYDSMERMAKAFHNAHQQIGTSMREMEKIAKTMEDGALVGDAGKAFVDAIRTKLIKRMKVIETKMQEMEKDVKAAVLATKEGVQTAGARFNN
jgi:WXG100 family type VII secretion target